MHRCRRRTDLQLQDLAEERAQLERDMADVKQALDRLDGAGIMILRDSKTALFITPVKEKP
jgi:hypothetical protein